MSRYEIGKYGLWLIILVYGGATIYQLYFFHEFMWKTALVAGLAYLAYRIGRRY